MPRRERAAEAQAGPGQAAQGAGVPTAWAEECQPKHAAVLEAAFARLDAERAGKKHEDEIKHASGPLKPADVRERYPNTRSVYCSPAGDAGGARAQQQEHVAVLHFDSIELDDEQEDGTNKPIHVAVGSDVMVNVDFEEEGHDKRPIAHVEEIFLNTEMEYILRVRWYYRSWSTVLAVAIQGKRKGAEPTAPAAKKARTEDGAGPSSSKGKEASAAAKPPLPPEPGSKKGKESTRVPEPEEAKEDDKEEGEEEDDGLPIGEGGFKMRKQLPVEEGGFLEAQRIWLATRDDNQDGYNTFLAAASVYDVVDVVWVPPCVTPPRRDNTRDHTREQFWYDQEYTRQFYTFQDLRAPLHPNHAAWLDQRGPTAAAARKQRDAAAGAAATSAGAGPKVFNVLDLCCGAGGLSFLAQRSALVAFRSRWAVDYVPDACHTYRVNHPDAWVTCTGIDEYLWQSRKFVKMCQARALLTQRLPAARVEHRITAALHAQLPTQRKRGDVVQVNDIRLDDRAPRGEKGQERGNLMQDLDSDDCWLSFRVLRHQHKEAEWVAEEELVALVKKQGTGAVLDRFLAYCLATSMVPIPGDVNVIAGGPPCQGVSGLNRAAEFRVVNILRDPRNRLVKTYYALVEWFEPEYVLMEQVMDTFKGAKAIYTKFAVAQLLTMRYQARVGIIAAGQHGCPQGRYRVFTWGARSGQQLPGFPTPSHHMPPYHNAIPLEAKCCEVKLLEDGGAAQAHPPTLLADILQDLPPVHNFDFRDTLPYPTPPNRPFNLYLRRPPPAHEAPLAARIAAADVILRPVRAVQGANLMLAAVTDPKKLGLQYMTRPSGKEHVNSTRQSVAADRPAVPVQCELMRAAEAQRVGKELRGIFWAAYQADEEPVEAPHGLVRDQRTYTNNYDDWTRMQAVPRLKGANFRHLPGVVTWGPLHKPSSTCCGHTHAQQYLPTAREGKRIADHLSKHGIGPPPPSAVQHAATGRSLSTPIATASASKAAGPAPASAGAAAGSAAGPSTSAAAAPAGNGAAAGAGAAGVGGEQDWRTAPAVAGGEWGAWGVAVQLSAEQRARLLAEMQGKGKQGSAAGGAKGRKKPGKGGAKGSGQEAEGASGKGGARRAKKGGEVRKLVVSDCPAGGTTLSMPRSNATETRIDHRDLGGWRGTELHECPSFTAFTPSGELLCPRWCATYKVGRSAGRQGCYGRLWWDDVQPTVVTRPQPHNLQLLHPQEDRVVTIRENARCQGFPDYYVLVGTSISGRHDRLTARGRDTYPTAFPPAPRAPPAAPLPPGTLPWDYCGCDPEEAATGIDARALFSHKAWNDRLQGGKPLGSVRAAARGKGSEVARYKLIGNAVAPPVAAALGMCLLKAAEGSEEHRGRPVHQLTEPVLGRWLEEAKQQGLRPYIEEAHATLAPVDLRANV